MKKKYNGRANRETRLINVFFDIEKKEDVEYAKEHIQELEKSIKDPFLKDYIDFSKINREELEKYLD